MTPDLATLKALLADDQALIQPLPWKPTQGWIHDPSLYVIHDKNGFAVCGGLTLDEAKFICGMANSAANLLDRLERAEALAAYARHTPECQAIWTVHCICGLDAARGGRR